MKLKEAYILFNASEEETIAVATGDEAESFSGLLRSNKTAGAILEYLREETTPEEITDKMAKHFDADRAEILEDVNGILEQLRSIGALEE